MNKPTGSATYAELATAIDNVGTLTYVSLILADTELRRLVKGEVDSLRAAGGGTSAQRDESVAKVTSAMTQWGFPQSTIDKIRLGQLTPEANIFTDVPDPLPNEYSLTGCTIPTVRPALELLTA